MCKDFVVTPFVCDKYVQEHVPNMCPPPLMWLANVYIVLSPTSSMGPPLCCQCLSEIFFFFSVCVNWVKRKFEDFVRFFFCRGRWHLIYCLVAIFHLTLVQELPLFRECRPLFHFPCHRVPFFCNYYFQFAHKHTHTHTTIDLQRFSELCPQPPAIISTLSHTSVPVLTPNSFRIYPTHLPFRKWQPGFSHGIFRIHPFFQASRDKKKKKDF